MCKALVVRKPDVDLHKVVPFKSQLIGVIGKGHPRIAEGRNIITSVILRVHGNVVETCNTFYHIKSKGVFPDDCM